MQALGIHGTIDLVRKAEVPGVISARFNRASAG